LLGVAPASSRADDLEERADAREDEADDASYPLRRGHGAELGRLVRGRETVSNDDLIAAIARPEFRGEDAAALAALEAWTRKGGPVDRATAQALDDPRTLKRYRTSVAKLRSANRVLFAPGAPEFARLQQGPAGDCSFFSGAGWIARYRPEVIRRAIAPLPDGRFQVTFPNGDSAVVTPPTDGELAANDSSSTLSDGLWMPVLEKATGAVMATRNARSAGIPDPTLAIDVPGGPAPIVERFTGRRVTGHHLGARAHVGKVRKALLRMHERRRMAEVLLRDRPAAKLPWNHVYAVLDFEPGSDVVVLWNPWGTDFQPAGPSGPENGYARTGGVFRIPLASFVDYFTFLAVEEG
jgi:hypothetical protein